MKTSIDAINDLPSLDPLFEQKFTRDTADLKRNRINQLMRLGESNSMLVTQYLNSKMREGNLKPATRASTIDRLFRLSLFHKNKSFREMVTEDIYSYLDTIRRTENEDPLHKWIGSYNLSVTKKWHFSNGCMNLTTIELKDMSPHFCAILNALKGKKKYFISKGSMDS